MVRWEQMSHRTIDFLSVVSPWPGRKWVLPHNPERSGPSCASDQADPSEDPELLRYIANIAAPVGSLLLRVRIVSRFANTCNESFILADAGALLVLFSN